MHLMQNTRRHTGRQGRRHQAGLSLVELMVGVAIGLIIVAAAAMVASTQLTDNRRLMLETQLQQDLRATSDIIARELRRHGRLTEEKTGPPPGSLDTLDSAVGSVPTIIKVEHNDWAPDLTSPGNRVNFNYTTDQQASPSFGFELVSPPGVIRTTLPGTTQDLTDVNVMKVTAFSVNILPATATSITLPCPALCTDGTTDCWPPLRVRDVEIVIQAEARTDARVKREMRSRVRVRADQVQFFNAATNDICPS